MPSSLLTGISGLVAHQRRLDVVANNLANLNTVGFKSQRTVFADLLYETLVPATNGSAAILGGSNPAQIGSGVKATQISKKMSQGTLEATGQALDFAIQGEGFFTLNDGSQDVYSRSGAFSLDQQGYLVDPATGYFVQRTGILGEGEQGVGGFQEPGDMRIKVPIGADVNGKTTSNVSVLGNLLGSAAGPTTEVLTSLAPFEASGSPATTATLVNDLDINTAGYTTGDEITIAGSNSDGSPFNVNLAVDATTTLGDVVNAINAQATDAGASIDAAGNLVFTANQVGESSLALSLVDDVGNVGGSNFDMTNPFVSVNGSAGESVQSSMQVYNLQGGVHNLNYTATKQGDNLWDLNFSIDPSEGVVVDGSVTGVRFADDGSFVSAGDAGAGDLKIEMLFNGIATPQVINIDVSKTTQYSTEFDISNSQDGSPPGKIAAISIGSDGAVAGVSTNGDKIPIGQIAIASFRNPPGLNFQGNSYYSASVNSGEASLGAGGLGGRGSLVGGQLEASNVDMALEFTQLIVAQRGFSANARTITVSNEMLQELTNVIR